MNLFFPPDPIALGPDDGLRAMMHAGVSASVQEIVENGRFQPTLIIRSPVHDWLPIGLADQPNWNDLAAIAVYTGSDAFVYLQTSEFSIPIGGVPAGETVLTAVQVARHPDARVHGGPGVAMCFQVATLERDDAGMVVGLAQYIPLSEHAEEFVRSMPQIDFLAPAIKKRPTKAKTRQALKILQTSKTIGTDLMKVLMHPSTGQVVH